MPSATTHRPRKRFGQNFLHDPVVIDRILACIDAQPGEVLLEIGPGQGALTLPLLQQQGRLTVVELDRDLIDSIKRDAAGRGELTVFNQDALNFDLAASFDRPVKVVGNLPYNISTPLLFHLLDQVRSISTMIFMLQKEVVERLSARANDSDYSRLTVMMQLFCNVEHCFNVSPEAFYPQPKVDSAIVKLTPKPNPAGDVDLPQFAKVVKQAFSQRRKVLKNNLKQWLTADDFKRLGISPTARAQELSLEDFKHISRYVQDADQ